MRRNLLSAVIGVLVAALATVYGTASPALAGAGTHAPAHYEWVNQLPWPAVAPAGYVAPDGYTTIMPELCYFSYQGTRAYLTGAATECLRQPGLHRAAALCQDGTIVYGWTEEMDYGLQSRVECGNPWGTGTSTPAVAAWGEYHLDVW